MSSLAFPPVPNLDEPGEAARGRGA